MVHVDTPDEEPSHHPRRKHRSRATALRLVSSPAARTAYVVIGVVGLAALAVAIVGPKRVRREALEPLGKGLETDFDKAWDEARPLREQITALLDKVGPEGRREIARKLQSWVGHFRAG